MHASSAPVSNASGPLGTVHEPERELAVSHIADVIVAGGGTAGIAAAITAARLGLKVIMVERTAIPGGMVTHVTSWLTDFDNKGGFAREFFNYVKGSVGWQPPYYNPFTITPYFDDLITESGVRPLYLCWAAAPLMEGGRVTGLIIESKSGRTALRAPIVVDATGDADIAAAAGADFQIGRPGDGACQSASLSHLLMNYSGPPIERDAFAAMIADAAARAGIEYRLPYDQWRVRILAGTTHAFLHGIPHVSGHDMLNADSLSDALVALRRQARTFFQILRDQAPLFKGIEFGPFSGLPGVRESRRIVGDALISDADIAGGASFNDGLFRVAHAVDLHRCAESDPALTIRPVKPYQVPYRALLPRGVEGLLVVGRCISGSHEAAASYRVIADCFAMGEAAAIAADLAIDRNCGLRDIPIDRLLAAMSDRGYAQ